MASKGEERGGEKIRLVHPQTGKVIPTNPRTAARLLKEGWKKPEVDPTAVPPTAGKIEQHKPGSK